MRFDDMTVLVPLDGSKEAETALAFLPALRPLGRFRVRLLAVAETPALVDAEQERMRARLAESYLDELGKRLERDHELAFECVRRAGVAYAEILEEARRPEIGLIVMTTRAAGAAAEDRLGNVADRVARGASCPTLLVGPNASLPEGIRRITVPLDGSAAAAEALPVARVFAEKLGSTVRLVQALNLPRGLLEEPASMRPITEALRSGESAGRQSLEEAAREIGTSRPVETAYLEGPPAQAVLRDLEEARADLAIMTSHGQRGYVPWALGSVTERLIRGPVPVLVLRPGLGGARRVDPPATASTPT